MSCGLITGAFAQFLLSPTQHSIFHIEYNRMVQIIPLIVKNNFQNIDQSIIRSRQ